MQKQEEQDETQNLGVVGWSTAAIDGQQTTRPGWCQKCQHQKSKHNQHENCCGIQTDVPACTVTIRDAKLPHKLSLFSDLFAPPSAKTIREWNYEELIWDCFDLPPIL